MKTQNNGNANQTDTQVQVEERVQENQFIEEQEQQNEVDNTLHRVILHNNENTSGEAVMKVLQDVFNHPEERAMRLVRHAHETDSHAVCWINNFTNCQEKLQEALRYCGQNAEETIDGCRAENGEGNRPHYYHYLEFEVVAHDDAENN